MRQRPLQKTAADVSQWQRAARAMSRSSLLGCPRGMPDLKVSQLLRDRGPRSVRLRTTLRRLRASLLLGATGHHPQRSSPPPGLPGDRVSAVRLTGRAIDDTRIAQQRLGCPARAQHRATTSIGCNKDKRRKPEPKCAAKVLRTTPLGLLLSTAIYEPMLVPEWIGLLCLHLVLCHPYFVANVSSTSVAHWAADLLAGSLLLTCRAQRIRNCFAVCSCEPSSSNESMKAANAHHYRTKEIDAAR